MADRYVLNLNQQSNGDYEVHKAGCYYFPKSNYDELGNHYGCSSAVAEAKRKHPYKQINGCKTCAEACHTS
ncbi:MAG: hypothetical protein WBJ10_16765 [Daejeonella sp.]|uniref:hypothetical protein n=1 Tax=Daejeonella sp. TaxID=2805397 RepID=UPI003C761F7E